MTETKHDPTDAIDQNAEAAKKLLGADSPKNGSKANGSVDAPPKSAAQPAAQAADPAPREPETRTVVPNVVINMPEPSKGYSKTPKSKKPPTGASSQATNSMLNKMLGSAATFKIRYIDDIGRVSLCGHYSISELTRVGGDVELFVQRYLVPKFGEGEYSVEALNEKGEIAKSQTYRVLDPHKDPKPPSPVARNSDVMQETLSRLWQRLEAIENKPQKDPLTQIQEMEQIKKQLGAGNDMQNMIMLMQLMQPKGPDPEVAALKQQIAQLTQQMQAMANQPPPPPPPPKEDAITMRDIIALLDRKPEKDTTAEMKELFFMVQPLLKDLFENRSSSQEKIYEMQMQHLNEKIDSLRGEGGGLNDHLENFQRMHGFVSQFGGGGSKADSFWEFASSAIESLAEPLSGLMSNVREREARQAQLPPAQMAQAGHPQQAPAATDGDETLPEGFADECRKIEDAEDAAERIKAIYEALRFLGVNGPAYRHAVMRILRLGRDGKKDEFLNSVGTFLNDCADREWISTETADQALEDCGTNYDLIQQMLQQAGKPAGDAE